MIYSKPAKTIPEQIALLKSRGLKITDEEKAAYYLSNISYYRLSAYLLSFQDYNNLASHTYMPWATLDEVIHLYVFDRELRLTCIDAIERIEVAFRCRLSHEYSIRHGNNWYEDRALYYRDYPATMNLISRELGRTGEIFIKHYNDTYTHPVNPPSWMTIEILSFGQLSRIYKNLRVSDAKKAVADHFGVHYLVLESWMENLSYIRNICAHHGRLWNRTLTLKAALPTNNTHTWISHTLPKPDKLYPSLCVMAYMLERSNKKAPFYGKLNALIHRFPKVSIQAMGFPVNWRSDLFWSEMFISNTYKARILIFKHTNWFR